MEFMIVKNEQFELFFNVVWLGVVVLQFLFEVGFEVFVQIVVEYFVVVVVFDIGMQVFDL